MNIIPSTICYNIIGIPDEHSTPKKTEGLKPEEQTLGVLDQAPLINIVDRDKLLFSVFKLLQNLGADERPEVG